MKFLDSELYKNSYVVAIAVFVILYLIFYIFNIGARREIINGVLVVHHNWIIPLIIAIATWAIWHFFLYPPAKRVKVNSNEQFSNFDRQHAPTNYMPEDRQYGAHDYYQ